MKEQKSVDSLLHKIYWDCVNGHYTKDKKCIPVSCGIDNEIYIETWNVGNGLVIDFAYCAGTERLYLEREAHFKRHNVDPRTLHHVTVPKKVYLEQVERLYND